MVGELVLGRVHASKPVGVDVMVGQVGAEDKKDGFTLSTQKRTAITPFFR